MLACKCYSQKKLLDMKRIILLIIISFCCSFNLYSKWYDGKFQIHPDYGFFKVQLDTLSDIPDVLKFVTRGPYKGIVGRNYPIFHLVENNDSLTLKLRYKVDMCKYAWVVVFTYNSAQIVVKADTLNLPLKDEWTDLSISVYAKDAAFLNINIQTEGECHAPYGQLYLSNFQLLNGETLLKPDIDDVLVEQIDSSSVISSLGMLDLPIMDKRILALGETSHGTETLSQKAFSLMQERIIKHNCRLVMMEFPMEYSLLVNRYVQGDEHFSIADISEFIQTTSLQSSPFISFIQWLRDFNERNKDKVTLLGFDPKEHFPFDKRVCLCKLLCNLNVKHYPSVDTLCVKIMDTDMEGKYILPIFEKNEELKEMLLLPERTLIRYSIEGWGGDRSSIRDSLMAEVAELSVDGFLSSGKTATFYAHFGHVGYRSSYILCGFNYHSMGEILKNRYADAYACIALSAFQGSAHFSNGRVSKILPLQKAPVSSIEYQLSRFRQDEVYFDMNASPYMQVCQLRCTGSNYLDKQFIWQTPGAAMDGLILFRETKPLYKPNDLLDSALSTFFNRYAEMRQKVTTLEKSANKQ